MVSTITEIRSSTKYRIPHIDERYKDEGEKKDEEILKEKANAYVGKEASFLGKLGNRV